MASVHEGIPYVRGAEPMKALLAMLYVALVGVMSGCTNHSEGNVVTTADSRQAYQNEGNTSQKTDWSARMTAAGAVHATDGRDQAFRAIALDAAAANRPAIVVKCLASMYSNDKMDQTAAAAARGLADAGNDESALKVAWLIRNVDLRDQTLKQVAGAR